MQPGDFRLLCDEADVGDYQFGAKVGHHRFCRACGIMPFGHGYVEELGGAYYSVNLACVDDLDPSTLAEASIYYMDGRNDNWANAPAEVRHL
ncbi:hypothetical protein D9M69_640230 [compost metagenome]